MAHSKLNTETNDFVWWDL